MARNSAPGSDCWFSWLQSEAKNATRPIPEQAKLSFEFRKLLFDFLNTFKTYVMLLSIIPTYNGTTDAILFVGGDKSGDFLTQFVNSLPHSLCI